MDRSTTRSSRNSLRALRGPAALRSFQQIHSGSVRSRWNSRAYSAYRFLRGHPMNLWQDVRYGARTLGKSPGFALTAILTLALGIGVTSSIFSVCDALLWRPVPLPHLETLVSVLQADPEPNQWEEATAGDIDDIRRGTTSLESLASRENGLANLAGAGGGAHGVLQRRGAPNIFHVCWGRSGPVAPAP